MARTYSISEGARLLGVSAATLSRRLPPERARRGRSAHLSLQELVALAPGLDADPEVVRRTATGQEALGPDLPAEARGWAELAAARDLPAALAAHVARIPDDLLQRAPEPLAPLELPAPWGDAGDWTPITSHDQLEELAPPARA